MYIFMYEEEEEEKNKGEQSVKPSAADIHPPPPLFIYLHCMRARVSMKDGNFHNFIVWLLRDGWKTAYG